MLKIGQSRDRLIFNIGLPIPGKDGPYIETGPWCLRLNTASLAGFPGLSFSFRI